MERNAKYEECPEHTTAMVAEDPTSTRRPVIPFVSREKAAEVFSSQRKMSWEEQCRQIDRSLGRLKDSE